MNGSEKVRSGGVRNDGVCLELMRIIKARWIVRKIQSFVGVG